MATTAWLSPQVSHHACRTSPVLITRRWATEIIYTSSQNSLGMSRRMHSSGQTSGRPHARTHAQTHARTHPRTPERNRNRNRNRNRTHALSPVAAPRLCCTPMCLVVRRCMEKVWR